MNKPISDLYEIVSACANGPMIVQVSLSRASGGKTWNFIENAEDLHDLIKTLPESAKIETAYVKDVEYTYVHYKDPGPGSY